MNPWIQAGRPKTLPASLSPVIVGLAIGGISDYLVATLTLLSALLLQVASNFTNDYFDSKNGIDVSDRIGPERGIIPRAKMKRGLITIFSLALFVGSYLMYVGGLPIIIVGLASLLFAYLYTGGPYPLSYYGLGELLAFFFFGPVAVCGTYYLQHFSVTIDSFDFGFGVGLIAAAIMSINNLRDIESDKLTKKRTIAIFLGEKKARMLTLCLVISPAVISIYFIVVSSWWFLLPLLSVISFRDFKKISTGKVDSELNISLAKCGQYMLCYSVAISIATILS